MAFIDDIQSRDTAIFPVVEITTPNKNLLTQLDGNLLIDLTGTGFPDEFPWAEEEMIEGSYYKIDDEIIKVRSAYIDLWNAPQVVLKRGQLGTEVVAHSEGSVIYRLGWYSISTKDFTLDNIHYSPLLLSTPSIKESIDLENRKYKISNVSLKISNVEYNGLRFSDSQIPLNTEVLIHWVSPSCTVIDDCYLAYKGTVRAITHDEKTCNITLEDISQSTLHRDVPITLLGTTDGFLDKYKNKPVPMVYGTVDKSPCVIGELSLYNELTAGSSGINIIIDNNTTVTSQPPNLSAFPDDTYINIAQSINDNIRDKFSALGYSFLGGIQYLVSENIITLQQVYADEGEEGNAVSSNHIIGYEYGLNPSAVVPMRTHIDWVTYNYEWTATHPDIDTTPSEWGVWEGEEVMGKWRGRVFREATWDGGKDSWDGTSMIPTEDGGGIGEDKDIWWDRMGQHDSYHESGHFAFVVQTPVVGSSSYIEHFGMLRASFNVWLYNYYRWWNPTQYSNVGQHFETQINSKEHTTFEGFGILSHHEIIGESDVPTDHEIWFHNSYSGSSDKIWLEDPAETRFVMYVPDWYTNNDALGGGGAGIFEMFNWKTDHYVLMDDMLKLDFYANNVTGRE